METFLLTGKIVDEKKAKKGVTDTFRPRSRTAASPTTQIQSVDISKPLLQAGGKTEMNFRLGKALLEPERLMRCDRALLDGMRAPRI